MKTPKCSTCGHERFSHGTITEKCYERIYSTNTTEYSVCSCTKFLEESKIIKLIKKANDKKL